MKLTERIVFVQTLWNERFCRTFGLQFAESQGFLAVLNGSNEFNYLQFKLKINEMMLF